MRNILLLLSMFLPWSLKYIVLKRIKGFCISKKSYIGFSFIAPKELILEEGSSIGHFNIAIHLDRIILGKNSTIGRDNWITGFPTGTSSKHFSHDKHRKSELVIGQESSITKKHHIDCTNTIKIGDFVTIAGYWSQFLTHSIDIYEGRQDSRPIIIGDYCFVSTNVTILGGSKLPDNSVLAAGGILCKKYDKEWTIYGGIPAKAIKEIPQGAKYFSRETGFIY